MHQLKCLKGLYIFFTGHNNKSEVNIVRKETLLCVTSKDCKNHLMLHIIKIHPHRNTHMHS